MLSTIIQPTKWKFWIITTISISLIQFIISFNYNKLTFEKPYLKVGDSFDYVSSSNAFLINNEFTFFKTTEWGDKSNLIYQKEFDKSLYYAYRSPGYAFILIPLLKLFNYNCALSLVVFLQFLCYGIAMYLLALIGLKLFKYTKLFYWIYFIGMFSIGLNFWNIYLYTESFAVSFLIISIYLLINGLESKNKWFFFFAGLALTESIMLRPFIAPSILVFSLLICSYLGFKKSIIYVFIYLSTFILIDGMWTFRNFIKTNEIIPLAATTKFHKFRNKAFLEHLEMHVEMGIPFSFNSWFFLIDDYRKVTKVFPIKVFKVSGNIKKMELAKNYYLKSLDKKNNRLKRANYELKSMKLQREITDEYKKENNSNWFTSRFGTSKILLNQGVVDVFKPKTIINNFSNRVQKILNNLIYYLGLFSVLIALFRFRKNKLILSILFIPIFIYLFFTITNIAETREMFIPSFFMLLFSLEFLLNLYYKKKYFVFILIFSFLLI